MAFLPPTSEWYRKAIAMEHEANVLAGNPSLFEPQPVTKEPTMNDPVSDQPVEAAMHLPLPWKVEIIKDKDTQENEVYISDADDVAVCHVTMVCNCPWTEPNAALIVQSVNRVQQYEAMVEALGDCLSTLAYIKDNQGLVYGVGWARLAEYYKLLPTTPKDKP